MKQKPYTREELKIDFFSLSRFVSNKINNIIMILHFIFCLPNIILYYFISLIYYIMMLDLISNRIEILEFAKTAVDY